MTSNSLKLALAATLGLAGIAQAADNTPAAKTMVEINGQAIKDTEFLAYRAQRAGGQHLDRKAQLNLLNQLINTVIVAQDAVAQGLDKEPAQQAALQVARYQILAEAAVSKYVREHPVSDQEIEAAYKDRYAPDKLVEYKARHILLDTEDEAKAVIAELDKGADFAELAKKKSTGPSGANGGDLGWFEAGQMVKPFADAVAGMKKGEHSAQPVHTQFGWHVIKLEDTRPQKAPTLDQVRAQLTKELESSRVTDFLRELRAKADVKLMDQGKAAPGN